MNIIEKFLQQIAITKWGSLQNARFSIVGDEINFRCPLCKDSKKDTKKKRFFYNIEKDLYNCQNCNRNGNLNSLIDEFSDFSQKLDDPNYIDYKELSKYTKNKVIHNYFHPYQTSQSGYAKQEDVVIIYPNGARLDVVLEDNAYKEFPDEEKYLLARVLKYLKGREIKSGWFRYFYFVFSDDPLKNYILTLTSDSNYDMDVWSGRLLDDTLSEPKYHHLKDFPFQKILGFKNEVSINKGKIVYVVESWFSALILNQEGYNAVCTFGINNMKFKHHPLYDITKENKHDLIFIPDNDKSFWLFVKNNKEHIRNMKVKMLKVDKDPADMKVRLKENFKKDFESLPTRSLENTLNVLRNI